MLNQIKEKLKTIIKICRENSYKWSPPLNPEWDTIAGLGLDALALIAEMEKTGVWVAFEDMPCEYVGKCKNDPQSADYCPKREKDVCPVCESKGTVEFCCTKCGEHWI